jgi:hypothetical protein
VRACQWQGKAPSCSAKCRLPDIWTRIGGTSRTGVTGVPLGSNLEVRARNSAIRFTPQEQTSSAGPIRSEKCQKQTLSNLVTDVRFGHI